MSNFGGHAHAHHFNIDAGMAAFDALPKVLRDFLNYDVVPWSPPAVAQALRRYDGNARLLLLDLRRQSREMTGGESGK